MNNDTKNILLRVTRELIDNNGIEAVSMRTVGKNAGLSRTALYRHFNNKESLLAAIVVEDFIMLGESIKKLEQTAGKPKQLLFKILIAYYDFAINNSEHYKLMFNTKWDKIKYPEIKQSAYKIFEKVSLVISKVIPDKQSNKKMLIKKTAILYAFIYGLAGLHLNEHNEVSKGLDDIKVLINHMLDALLKSK